MCSEKMVESSEPPPEQLKMPKPKPKNGRISSRSGGQSPLSPNAPSKRPGLLELARELQQVAIETTMQLGISRKDQQTAFRLAIKGAMRGRPSKRVMVKAVALADLLSNWRRDTRYTDTNGTPRVLPVNGRGTTLESLARRFVPSMPLNEVVAGITRHSEVTLLPGNKVALVGGAAILTPKSPEMALATLTIGFRRLAGTILWNVSLPEGKKGQGRFERQVVGRLSDRSFKKYSQVMRTQLVDVLDRSEAGLEVGSKRRAGKSCGIGLYVFQDD
jgi:Family of unknown function (DUF6502)